MPGVPMPGEKPMDATAEMRLFLLGARRTDAPWHGIDPSLQIVEASLDHWEILLGDPKVCVRI
jgi:hypothetical protein